MKISEITERAGGVVRLARALGMSHASICKWKRVGRIPTHRAIAINRLLDIPLHEMRPDIWAAPDTRTVPNIDDGDGACIAQNLRLS